MIDVLEALSDDDLSADSSIVLTYELQLPLYDGWIRRRLSAAGANIQLVFCDLGCYERELAALSKHFGRCHISDRILAPRRCCWKRRSINSASMIEPAAARMIWQMNRMPREIAWVP